MTRAENRHHGGARLFVLSIVALAGCSAAETKTAKPAGVLQVVELFQSQGCSSCPPAIENVNAIADRPDVLALTFAVTYWDRLGWKDSFAKPEFTARQWDYAKAGGRGQVFTPQILVNGRTSIVGARRAQLDQAMATTPAPVGGPAITARPGKIMVGAGAAPKPATVWLVDYDPRAQAVAIGAGENSGRTLVHRNVVTGLVPLGRWQGAALTLALPPARAGLRRAVLVQQDRAGPIVAAHRL